MKHTKDSNIELFITLIIIMTFVISLGTIGYHVFGDLAWIDAFHNGSMIFTTTGLVTPVNSYEGKLFSSFYNLFCGVFIIFLIGLIVRKLLPDQSEIKQSEINHSEINHSEINSDHSEHIYQNDQKDEDDEIHCNLYSVLNDSSMLSDSSVLSDSYDDLYSY